jgi:hypothetical protein
MKARELYEIVFTEYPTIGFSPAIVAMAIVFALGAAIVYGGITLSKAYFAQTSVVETGRS